MSSGLWDPGTASRGESRGLVPPEDTICRDPRAASVARAVAAPATSASTASGETAAPAQRRLRFGDGNGSEGQQAPQGNDSILDSIRIITIKDKKVVLPYTNQVYTSIKRFLGVGILIVRDKMFSFSSSKSRRGRISIHHQSSCRVVLSPWQS